MGARKSLVYIYNIYILKIGLEHVLPFIKIGFTVFHVGHSSAA